MNSDIPDFHKQMERDKQHRAKTMNRREWIKYSLLGGTGLLGSAGYISYEAQWIEVTKREIMLKTMHPKASFKLLHLSDLHLSNVVSLEYLTEALKKGLSLSPHACIITGDFVTGQPIEQNLADYSKLLRKFAARVPTYACLGNHDGGKWAVQHGGYPSNVKIRKLLEYANVKVLENEREEVYLNSTPIFLAGVGDLWSGNCKPSKCLDKLPIPKNKRTIPTILLNHNPDAKEGLIKYGWDLMLSGHTHGGQFIVPFKNFAPFAPVKDKSIVQGAYNWKDRIIHISRGVGNLYGIRLNCRPEVTLLNVTGIVDPFGI
jgi:predicted MPP superfamily phosphohydrolase